MTDEFNGDETLLTFHETPSLSLLAISAKLMIFNVMKLSMKLPLKLALTKENLNIVAHIQSTSKGHKH